MVVLIVAYKPGSRAAGLAAGVFAPGAAGLAFAGGLVCPNAATLKSAKIASRINPESLIIASLY
jgi:hypothetical protein